MIPFLIFILTWKTQCKGEMVEFDYSENVQYGIDISFWQGTFNGTVAKKRNVSRVMARAGFGEKTDECFAKFNHAASIEGIEFGAYWTATFHDSNVSQSLTSALKNAKKQAQLFIQQLQEANISSFCGVDIELELGHECSLNSFQLTECTNSFCDYLKAAGYKPVIYGSIKWLFHRMAMEKIRYPIWCAYYFKYGSSYDFTMWDGSFPGDAYGNQMKRIQDRIVMWQFTSEGYGKKYGCGSTNLCKSYCYT